MRDTSGAKILYHVPISAEESRQATTDPRQHEQDLPIRSDSQFSWSSACPIWADVSVNAETFAAGHKPNLSTKSAGEKHSKSSVTKDWGDVELDGQGIIVRDTSGSKISAQIPAEECQQATTESGQHEETVSTAPSSRAPPSSENICTSAPVNSGTSVERHKPGASIEPAEETDPGSSTSSLSPSNLTQTHSPSTSTRETSLASLSEHLNTPSPTPSKRERDQGRDEEEQLKKKAKMEHISASLRPSRRRPAKKDYRGSKSTAAHVDVKATHDTAEVETAGSNVACVLKIESTVVVDTVEPASRVVAEGSAGPEIKQIEAMASKLESLDGISGKLPLAQVVEPHVGPECFAIPISNYLVIVERENEMLSKQAREWERERDAFEAQVRELTKETNRLGKRREFIREVEVVEVASGIRCDCNICKRQHWLETYFDLNPDLNEAPVPRASSSKLLLEGCVQQNIEEDNEMAEVDSGAVQIDGEPTESKSEGIVLSDPAHDVMEVDTSRPTADGPHFAVPTLVPMVTAQLGMLAYTLSLVSSQAQLFTMTEYDAGASPLIDSSAHSVPATLDRVIKPLSPSRARPQRPNNTITSSSTASTSESPIADDDYVNPELRQLVESGLPPWFRHVYSGVPEGPKPEVEEIHDTDETTEEEKEALAAEFAAEFERAMQQGVPGTENKPEGNKVRDRKGRGKARQNKSRRW